MYNLKSSLKYTTIAAGFLLTGCFMFPNAEAHHHHHHKHHHHPENVAIVLPLSGPQSAVANQLKNAALLGLNDPRAHHTAVIDSAQFKSVDEIQAKLDESEANIIIGPLLAEEAEKMAPLAKDDSFIFSLTSDDRMAHHHEWVMGITPLQQIKPLIKLATERNREHFAAFLPNNDYGHAMGAAFEEACDQLGTKKPTVVYHGFSNASIDQDFARLVGGDAEAEDPKFDALFLGDTGTGLRKVLNYLHRYKVDSRKIQIMGPGSWQLFDGTLGDIPDAWYAAPAELRASYKRLYREEFGQTPSAISAIAYDVGLLADNIHKNPSIVSSGEGFTGLNGWFKLEDDGHVERSLSIYKILAGGGAGRIFQAPEMTAEVKTKAEEAPKVEEATSPAVSAPATVQEKPAEVKSESTTQPEKKGFLQRLGLKL